MTLSENEIYRISEGIDVILVGPNGSGKSRTLRELCKRRIRQGKSVIAISNTQYSRLPDYSRERYNHIRVGPDTTNSILKSLVAHSLDSKSRSYSSMREVLDFTGYLPVLDVNISIGKLRHKSERFLSEMVNEAPSKEWITDEIRDIFDRLKSFEGEHQIDLENITKFFSEKEMIAVAIKNQTLINRILRQARGKLTISFGLRKKTGHQVPISKASSGELTLITLAMFVLSSSEHLDYVFIDEPENSLHPQWQSNFLKFMKDATRRENISYQIASHSSVLLSGALTAERKPSVVRCRFDSFEELSVFDKVSDDSVEEILWNAFDLITPASRYVAKRISDLFWQLQSGQVQEEEVVAEIEQFIKKSLSNDQIDFLKASIELAKNISSEEVKQGD